MQNYIPVLMQHKSKNKVSRSYVEIRDAKRRAEKQEIRRQLAQGDHLKISALSGKSLSAVQKALNPNQQMWSQAVIDSAKEFIADRQNAEHV